MAVNTSINNTHSAHHSVWSRMRIRIYSYDDKTSTKTMHVYCCYLIKNQINIINECFWHLENLIYRGQQIMFERISYAFSNGRANT